MQFDVPNLDGLTIDPAEMRTASETFHWLSVYASLKAMAMEERLAGKVGLALANEGYADVVYAMLPEWARW